MYNNHASPIIRNVTFSRNAAGNGGGMLNNASSSPLLTNVTFVGNFASLSGGGMYNNAGSSPLLANVTFASNSAINGGGGMFNISDSSPVLTNVTFSGNSATEGGGIYNYKSSSPLLTNVTFSGNNATKGTGKNVVNNTKSLPVFVNTLEWGNGILNINSSSYTPYFSLIQEMAADANGNLNGVTATKEGIFGNATLADNGNPFAQTIAIDTNGPAAGSGALLWKSGADYYASKGDDIFKINGTGTGKINALPAGATLISTGGANKNNTVTPTADPPAIYPDIGAYQH